jgi:hypothetical protein
MRCPFVNDVNASPKTAAATGAAGSSKAAAGSNKAAAAAAGSSKGAASSKAAAAAAAVAAGTNIQLPGSTPQQSGAAAVLPAVAVLSGVGDGTSQIPVILPEKLVRNKVGPASHIWAVHLLQDVIHSFVNVLSAFEAGRTFIHNIYCIGKRGICLLQEPEDPQLTMLVFSVCTWRLLCTHTWVSVASLPVTQPATSACPTYRTMPLFVLVLVKGEP